MCSLYPFSVQDPLGDRGVYLGANLTAGGASFVWDPFEAYDAGLVTNPNVWVMGEPGNAKSSLVKSYLYRQAAVYGPARWTAVCDPKGEYLPLAEALGFDVVRLAPGGPARINPLDGDAAADTERADQAGRRAEMVAALVATTLERPLSAVEDAVLWAAVEQATRRRRSTPSPTLADVASLLREPTAQMAERCHKGVDELVRAAEPVFFELDRLLHRSLRGMFDGESTVRVDWDGPGMVLDLSAVHTDRHALPLVMAAAHGWLNERMATRTGRQWVQVLDEAYWLLGNLRMARYLQSSWKLGRSYGVANIAVAHRPSDLAAQADDGSATAKIAAGLLADTATKVVFRQAPGEVAGAGGELLGLREVEREVVRRLVRGRALWRIGERTAVVAHVVGSAEERLVDTDGRMRAAGAPGVR